MGEPVKIGILGAGNIAATLAYTMRHMEEVECYGVASRSLGKAQEFAGKHGFLKAYGSPRDGWLSIISIIRWK